LYDALWNVLVIEPAVSWKTMLDERCIWDSMKIVVCKSVTLLTFSFVT